MTSANAFNLHGLPGSFVPAIEIVFGPDKSSARISGLDRLWTLNPGYDCDKTILRALDAESSPP